MGTPPNPPPYTGGTKHHFKTRFNGLEQYTVDKEGLIAFIRRLQNHQGEDKVWLESIATFLAKVPPRKKAEVRFTELSHRLHDLAKLQSQGIGKPKKKGTKAVLIRTMHPKKGELDQIAYIEPKQQTKINRTVKTIQQRLEKIGDHQLQLAVIAELLDKLNSDVDK
ncbi:hypothetical protein [Candidatus Parabeggiatoa sp. HSG14]|uniref:hypothetical protein n=1 Tax=Candidatus Parabeggiatoa sp. HSG14 TaxID=3055593 RepID=UPI0025A8534E|nr:hypothetical protein [Thiotrichales bacterium HSG14]